MASLKHELDQWNEGVIAFDQGQYEDALEIFEPIADSAKIHFNIGVVLTTLGDFDGASQAYEEATKLDQYLAIAYFQNGVANVALENYAKALACFHDAYLYLRGNMVIDYTQLGLDFKLYSCQVLFNRALCYIELGDMDLGMTDIWRATREKQTKAHDILDQALRDRGQDCTVFTVPQGVLYRPAESKIKNAKKKDYLGNSKVIAAVDSTDQFAGFAGKSAWQVQMSGPINVAAVDEPRPMTPPTGGLQRRATERITPGMGAAGRPQMLEHSNSFNGMDRRGPGPGPSNLGPAGSESTSKSATLVRRNTESQRSLALTIDGNNQNNRGGPASAAPGGQQSAGGRGRYQDEMDEIDQHVYALSLDADRYNRNMNEPPPPVPALPASQTGVLTSQHGMRDPSPGPTRSNSATRPGMPRKGSVSSGPSPPGSILNGGQSASPKLNMANYSTSPPNGRPTAGTAPVLAELRRMGSGRGLSREDSVRSAGSNGAYTSQPANASPLSYNHSVSSGSTARLDEGAYLGEPAYASLRDK
ncbi:hypothetical protein BG011_001474, partial [Mortierella polycephala]